jgi:FAD:protein FMN transferase
MLRLHCFPFTAMGSPCMLQLYARKRLAAKRIAALAMVDVRRLEARYSRYRPDSVLSAISRIAADGGTITVDAETAQLLNYAHVCYRQSDGLFDISSGLLRQAWDFHSSRLPEPSQINRLLNRVGWHKIDWCEPLLTFPVPGMELDFGGIGKEYAADRAAALCLKHGIAHGLIDLGGDIKIIGPHPDGSPWQVGIRHPRHPNTVMARIPIHHGGIASSGDYERFMMVGGRRYSHLLDPETGWPVHGVCAVTVVAEHCLVAGSACTIAMLKGERGPAWLEVSGFHALWMDHKGKIGETRRAGSRLTPVSNEPSGFSTSQR